MRAATTLTAREAWALRKPVRHTGGHRVEVYAEALHYAECRDHPGWRIPAERLVLRNAYWGHRGNRIPERQAAPEAAERVRYLVLATLGHHSYEGPCAHLRTRYVMDAYETWFPISWWQLAKQVMPDREECSCEWCSKPYDRDTPHPFPQMFLDQWEATRLAYDASPRGRLLRRALREVKRDRTDRTPGR